MNDLPSAEKASESLLYSFWLSISLMTKCVIEKEAPITLYDLFRSLKYFFAFFTISIVTTLLTATKVGLIFRALELHIQNNALALATVCLGQWALIKAVSLLSEAINHWIYLYDRDKFAHKYRKHINQQWLNKPQSTQSPNNHQEYLYNTIHYLVRNMIALASVSINLAIILFNAFSLTAIPYQMIAIIASVNCFHYLTNQWSQSLITKHQSRHYNFISAFRENYSRFWSHLHEIRALNLDDTIKNTLDEKSQDLQNISLKRNLISVLAQDIIKPLGAILETALLYGSLIYFLSIGVFSPEQAFAVISVSTQLSVQIRQFAMHYLPYLQNEYQRDASIVARLWRESLPESTISYDISEHFIQSCYQLLIFSLYTIALAYTPHTILPQVLSIVTLYVTTVYYWPHSYLSLTRYALALPDKKMYRSSNRKKKAAILKPNDLRTTITSTHNDKTSKLNRDFSLNTPLKPGQLYLLSAENGVGKSLFFGQHLANKLPRDLESTSMGCFKSSIITAKPYLLPNKDETSQDTILTRLANTFSIAPEDHSDLETYIIEQLEKMFNGSALNSNLISILSTRFNSHEDRWGSDGEKQQLYILTLAYKLSKEPTMYDFIMIDETISGVHADRCPQYYKLITDITKNTHACTVIVHHNYKGDGLASARTITGTKEGRLSTFTI